MAETDFPADLLDAQRSFWAADARVRELLATLPLGSAIAACEAEITEEQHAALKAARDEQHRWLDVLYDHSHWATVADSYAERMKLQAAAKE
ncbi:hypothetical protein IMZ11_02240 [Microtetraspora sp. AC03309]|uniref:hypothetical protein n=1 Tax=Microtetraspora sp. AC03309 TaxID=2779376 RepID=UPI001E4826AB|nr:hypothetical protein [Microtetraspora sp. AC03309]MCC5574460.1 hypothetical protein [Microtetraspora sp. AC03309]